MNNISVISAFPGTGKSYLSKLYPNICSDSDSSLFSKNKDGTKNLNFIKDYIDHIKSMIECKAFVFVSSHDEVRKELIKQGINFFLVYPERSLKNEYVERYEQRGSPIEFVNLIKINWESFINSCEATENCTHIVLKSGQYINDILKVEVI